MCFDCILANSPYGKPGVDITKYIMENFPDSNYAMLGTRSMFKPFYADTLACAFVQIGKYELGSNQKLDWGVEQAILLATNGWTETVDNRKKEGKNKVGVNEPYVYRTGTLAPRRSTHLVGTCISPVTIGGYITGHITEMCEVQGDMRGKLIEGHRTSHLVGIGGSPCIRYAQTHLRNATLVQVNKSGPYLGATMDTKPTDVKLRNGYVYVAFETFEEACECAIDIISWKNPTDSHYRCIRWGFVCGLIPHERLEK